MPTVLEELVTVLGFEIDDENLEKYGKLTQDLESSLRTLAKTGLAATVAFGAFTTVINNNTDALFKWSKGIGANFQDVQKLIFAADIWGASVDDVTSSLSALTNLTSQAARQGSAIFGFLGIDPRDAGGLKDSVALLSEIADKIQGLEPGRQLDLIQQMGLSENMLLLLRKGRAEIERLGTELDEIGFILTEEQAETAEAYVDAVIRAKLAITGLANQIAVRFAPVFIDTIEMMLDWVRASKGMIDSNLDRWIENFLSVLRPLAFAMAGIGATLAGWAIFANPVLAGIALVITAFGFLLDEFLNWTAGTKDTLLAKLLGEPEDVKKSFAAWANYIKNHPVFKFLSGFSFGGLFGSTPDATGINRPLSYQDVRAAGLGGGFGFPQITHGSPGASIVNNLNINSTDAVGIINEIPRVTGVAWSPRARPNS